MEKRLLLRYDTEGTSPEEMKGFFEKAVLVHRKDAIPATFFCMGAAIEARESEARAFFEEVKDDPLFDIQDHSYSHVGLGYERGKPVEVLRSDYERSFAVHERVFGKRPTGVSICGTGGKDGWRLAGFDQTEKAKAELDMMAKMGVRMINAFLSTVDESRDFTSFESIGHPEVMGFPSGYGDTAWMARREFGDPMSYILGEIDARAASGDRIPVMLHDWVAWMRAEDRELTHVRRIAEKGRKLEYRLVTHFDCYLEEDLWCRLTAE